MTNVDRTPQHSPATTTGDLISLNEAAKLLDQPVENVFRDVMCGRLPVVWLGPRPYVDRAALSNDDNAANRTTGCVMSQDQPPPPHDADLMTLSRAAAFLRVRPTELMTATRNGEVPFYQRRGRILFSRAELLQRMQNPHIRRGDGQPTGGEMS